MILLFNKVTIVLFIIPVFIVLYFSISFILVKLLFFFKYSFLKEVLQINENSLIKVLNFIKRLASFINTCIAYKMLLTIFVIIPSEFIKIKIDKILFKIKYVTKNIT